MAHNPAIGIAMVSKRLRECIIALGAASIVAVAIHLWRQQYAVDLPMSPPAQRIDAGLSAQDVRPYRAAVRATPAVNPGTWLSDSDYPAEAMRNGWEGATSFRLTIDSSGKPERCEIVQSSGHTVLDEATCDRLMRNARFRPGRNASESPVTDVYNGRVSWRMPQ